MSSIAVDEHFAYIAEYAGGIPEEGAVLRVSKDDGQLVALVEGLTDPRNVAVDDDHVYWVSDGSRHLQRVRKSGGDPEDVGPPLGTNLIVDGNRIYGTHGSEIGWVSPATGEFHRVVDAPVVTHLALAGPYLYFATLQTSIPSAYSISRADKHTGGSMAIATSEPAVAGLAADCSHVYWARNEYLQDAEVVRAPREGGQPEVFVRDVPHVVGSKWLALDATHLYWIDVTAGAVRRKAVTGGPVETVALGYDDPRALTLDDCCVYFTTWHLSGFVVKVAK